ncbi:MAG: saccharopine dehydrogenase [Bacteroidetes bacterium]|nr:saccharopine dehydrogenase [Bacteroidota bacterium]
MAKVTVLGGAGVVGTASVQLLAASEEFSEIVVADIDLGRAQTIAEGLGDKVSAVAFDAMDPTSIKKVIEGSSVVINTVGPYYKFEKIILSAVIDSGINYLDVNDDTGATYDALALDEAAKSADITALIGMGSSPGVTNLLALFVAKFILAKCDSIDIFHAHGGEPTEGPGVIGHRFYCMRQDVPVFIDGVAKDLSQKEAEGLIEEVEFYNLPGKHLCYPYPHPEPITMPKWIDGVQKVTNKGTVLPESYYDLTRKVFAAGLDSLEEVDVKGKKIVPYDFAISYLIKRRDELLEEEGFGDQRGCVKIVVAGENAQGLKRTYIFSLISEGIGKAQGLGEGTGYPAALAAILMNQGKITKRGVVPPEACINPLEFLMLMKKALQVDDSDESKKSPVVLEKMDENGVLSIVDLSQFI